MKLPEPFMSVKVGRYQKVLKKGIIPSAAGTCDCHYKYGPTCSTQTDNCAAGYHAQCQTTIYSCGCQCRPAT